MIWCTGKLQLITGIFFSQNPLSASTSLSHYQRNAHTRCFPPVAVEYCAQLAWEELERALNNTIKTKPGCCAEAMGLYNVRLVSISHSHSTVSYVQQL